MSIATPVTEKVLFLERQRIEELQEKEDCITFAMLKPEPACETPYYPAAILKIATDALIAENHRQGGNNFELSKAIMRLQFVGVPVVC
jgi:hypothetical protein